MGTTPTHLGGCLCGRVRYEVRGELPAVRICHCTECRRAQGSAFAANLPVPDPSVRFTSGESSLILYESSPGKVRAFCGGCGSPVFSRNASVPGVLRLRAGLLDDQRGLEVDSHAWGDERAAWLDACEHAPVHGGARP